MNLAETIGRNLAAIRDKRGLSQEVVADYLGIARPMISYYEKAQRPVPLAHLEKMASLYGIEVSDLTSEKLSEQKAGMAIAFRTEGLSIDDLQSIGSFQDVVMNYLKMIELIHEKEQGHRD